MGAWLTCFIFFLLNYFVGCGSQSLPVGNPVVYRDKKLLCVTVSCCLFWLVNMSQVTVVFVYYVGGVTTVIMNIWRRT